MVSGKAVLDINVRRTSYNTELSLLMVTELKMWVYSGGEKNEVLTI